MADTPSLPNARIHHRPKLFSPDLNEIVPRSTADQRCHVNDVGPANESNCGGSYPGHH